MARIVRPAGRPEDAEMVQAPFGQRGGGFGADEVAGVGVGRSAGVYSPMRRASEEAYAREGSVM